MLISVSISHVPVFENKYNLSWVNGSFLASKTEHNFHTWTCLWLSDVFLHSKPWWVSLVMLSFMQIFFCYLWMAGILPGKSYSVYHRWEQRTSCCLLRSWKMLRQYYEKLPFKNSTPQCAREFNWHFLVFQSRDLPLHEGLLSGFKPAWQIPTFPLLSTWYETSTAGGKCIFQIWWWLWTVR